jgi:hypothetical protein
MRTGHGETNVEEVKRYLKDIYLYWMRGVENDSVFCYLSKVR